MRWVPPAELHLRVGQHLVGAPQLLAAVAGPKAEWQALLEFAGGARAPAEVSGLRMDWGLGRLLVHDGMHAVVCHLQDVTEHAHVHWLDLAHVERAVAKVKTKDDVVLALVDAGAGLVAVLLAVVPSTSTGQVRLGDVVPGEVGFPVQVLAIAKTPVFDVDAHVQVSEGVVQACSGYRLRAETVTALAKLMKTVKGDDVRVTTAPALGLPHRWDFEGKDGALAWTVLAMTLR